MSDIGDRIKERRKVLNLSQAALAARVGMTQSGVKSLETNPKQKTRSIVALAQVLGVTPEWLETGKAPNSSGQETTQNIPMPPDFGYWKSKANPGWSVVHLEEEFPNVLLSELMDLLSRAREFRRLRDES